MFNLICAGEVSDGSPRALDAVIRVYDETGSVIETHEHAGEFKEE